MFVMCFKLYYYLNGFANFRIFTMANSVDDILKKPFSSRNYESKLKIVSDGKPRPALDNLVCKHKDKKSEYTRHFSTSHYEKVEWLTGCQLRCKLFCWPCLLFARESCVWNKQGFSDLNHLTFMLQKHEKSQAHVQAFLAYKMFGKQRIDTLLDSQRKAEIHKHNEQVNKNREILKRLIDAVCYLAKQELPFRGHDESSESVNRGNYIEFLNVLRKYDAPLDTHLNTSTVFQGTSPAVQNDIIQAVADVLVDHIKVETSSASFFAIILDETSDVMSKSQLSSVLRYVHDGEVHERFVGFSDVSDDRTADGLFRHVVKIVEEFQMKDKLVGQTYDGASVMSGHANGLQKKVLDEYPLAIFTHCYAHILNLVLQQGLSNIKECRIFFQTLSGLAAFFSKSSKRVHALQEFVARKLPTVAPTRWNFTSRLSNTVQEYRPQLLEFFQHIIENSTDWDNDTVVRAQGFKSFLQDFQTVVLLEIFSKLFGYTDVLYNVLQSKVFDVLYCCKKINEVLQKLMHDKEHEFENLWASVVSSRSSNNDDDHISQRPKRVRVMVDEDEKTHYLTLYQNIVESVCMQIKTRYSSLSKLEFFQLLWHEKYEVYKRQFPDTLLTKLKDFYASLFDYIRLKNELVVLYSSPEFADKNVHELVEFMVKNGLQYGFQEAFRLAELILTIPSNTASAERSFSALKRINSCYRGTQSQLRLSGLSLLSIEKNLLNEVKQRDSFYDEVINKFVSKTRRIELNYK